MGIEIIIKKDTINDIHSTNGIGLHDNLQDKLDGKIPVTYEDLIVLINSWGRTDYIYIDVIGYAEIDNCEPTQSEQALLVRTQSEQTRFVRT